MARRLIDPVWKVVVEKGDDRAKFNTLNALVHADPAGVLEKLESAKFLNKVWEIRIQAAVAEALAGTDPEEAGSIAESIADPARRAGVFPERLDPARRLVRPRGGRRAVRAES